MNYNITTDTDSKFPWKLTVDGFVAHFSSLSAAEEEGGSLLDPEVKGFTIEHVIETREYKAV